MTTMRGLLATAVAILAFQAPALAQGLLSDDIQVLVNGTNPFPPGINQTFESDESSSDYRPFRISVVVPAFTTSGTTRYVFLTEPGTTQHSDAIGVTVVDRPSNSQNVQITGISDTENGLDETLLCGPNGCPPGVALPETGQFQDVTAQLGLGNSVVTVMIRSDLDGVPEPGTLLLLGPGLVGLVASARRRRTR